MTKKRSLSAFIGALAGILAGSIAASGGANAALITVGDQTGTLTGIREFNLPAAKVTDWCLTMGEFDPNENQYTWNYRVTFDNTKKRTAATHIQDKNTNLRITIPQSRVVVLRPGKSQVVTVAPLDTIHTTDISSDLSRDLNLSKATVIASKKQARKLRQGKRVKGTLYYDQNHSRSLPATLAGDTLCPGESISQDTRAEVITGNRDSRDLIYPLSGAEVKTGSHPSASYLSKFDEFHTDRDTFLKNWTSNAIRGWDDAAASRPMAVTSFNLDTFTPKNDLSAAEAAYINGYLGAAGYYDYRNSAESRTERLAGAPLSVRAHTWVFEYDKGWELAQYYEQYSYMGS